MSEVNPFWSDAPVLYTDQACVACQGPRLFIVHEGEKDRRIENPRDANLCPVAADVAARMGNDCQYGPHRKVHDNDPEKNLLAGRDYFDDAVKARYDHLNALRRYFGVETRLKDKARTT